MNVVHSAVFGWAKSLPSSLQNTKDVKYLDLQRIGGKQGGHFPTKT